MRKWSFPLPMILLLIAGLTQGQEIAADFKSAEINAEVKKLPELRKTLETLLEARIKVARGELIDKLKAYQTTATQAGDLDEAVKVRNAIAELEALQDAAEKTIGKKEETKPVKKNIPKNAVRFGDSRYFVVTDPKSWTDAKKFCEEQGGHLARIESAEEHAFCAKLIQPLRANGAHAWALVDGNDVETKGTYVFGNGDEVKYIKWDVKKPTGRADCRYLGLYSVTGLYYDCEDKPQPFICEWE